jgi:hypothetical protein
MATEDIEGYETESVATPAANPAPPANLEALNPRLAVAVDGWWNGNMVGGEEWQQRQSYGQRDDLKNLITRTLEGA